MPDDQPAISNPVTGVSIRDAPGEGAAEIRLAPGAQGPAEHVHRTTEERFEVLAGRVAFRVDGRERTLGAGTGLRVSPGTPHAFRNPGDEPARLTVRTVPPNDRLGEVVATLFGLAHDGAVDERGRPGPLRAAAMAEATLDETYFTGVPYLLQRAFGAALGPAARRLGYGATEERYLDEAFWQARTDGGDDADDADDADGRATGSTEDG